MLHQPVAGRVTTLAQRPQTYEIPEILKTNCRTVEDEFNIGSKLPKLFRSIGIAHPQIKFYQPVFLAGRQKRFLEYTYAAHLPFLVAAGIATQDEIEAHLAALCELNDDESQASPQFRLIQVWGRG